MTESLLDKPCIALEPDDRDPWLFTVAEYDEDVRRARRIGTKRGLRFHGVAWAEYAPYVHQLNVAGFHLDSGLIRISDPEAYDLQMRRLLGLI